MAEAIREAAVKYFLEQDCNCAESVFRAACDALGLPAGSDAAHAVGIFGGGLGCGELCGAMAGAAAALGVKFIDTRAHQCPAAREAAAEMTARFLKRFGSLRCEELKPRYSTDETRCAALVGDTAEILQKLCGELEAKAE